MKRLGFVSAAAAPLLLLPVLVFAQAPATNFGWFGSLFGTARDFINDILLPVIFALAVVVFFWGVFTYFVLGGADEGKREQGRSLILYAIIGFVLFITIFGIVEIVDNALFNGASNGPGDIELPNVGTTPATNS